MCEATICLPVLSLKAICNIHGNGRETARGRENTFKIINTELFPARIVFVNVGSLFLCYGNLEETSNVTTSFYVALYH